MIVNGKALAEDIIASLRQRVIFSDTHLTLTIISIAPNFATEKYVSIKRRVAKSIGVSLREIALPLDTTTEQLISIVREHTATSDGIVLQLPYPEHIDTQKVLDEIPRRLDVDVIGAEAVRAYSTNDRTIHPPVVSAIAHIAKKYDVSWQGSKVVIVGQGRLVGKPATLWATTQGANIVCLTKESVNSESEIGEADIIILGAGVPNLVTPSMVKEGVVIFDAGASEDSGRLAGDADPACADKTALFTPVPGGIGPIAVAKLFENLFTLWSNESPE